MRKILVFVFFLLMIVGFNAVDSIAAGLGVYGMIGSGKGDGKIDVSGFPSESVDFDTKYTGYGLVLDTAAGEDKVFNYRLNLGFEKLKFEGDSGDVKLNNYVLDQDFGFGVLRSDVVRLWLGPELRVSYATGKDPDFSDIKYKFWGFGIGPVAGIDFNLGDTLTLALKGGYLYTKYLGTMDGSAVSADYNFNETHAFGSVALIFRFDGPSDDDFGGGDHSF